MVVTEEKIILMKLWVLICELVGDWWDLSFKITEVHEATKLSPSGSGFPKVPRSPVQQ